MKKLLMVVACCMLVLCSKNEDDRSDKAKAFADSTFSVDKYNAWIVAYKPIYFYNNRLYSLPVSFSRDLSTCEPGSDQYYDMIKNPQFAVGWKDGKSAMTGKIYNTGDALFYGDHNYSSANQSKYKEMWPGIAVCRNSTGGGRAIPDRRLPRSDSDRGIKIGSIFPDPGTLF